MRTLERRKARAGPVCIVLMMRIADPELILIGEGPVDAPGGSDLILGSGKEVVRESDRDGGVQNGGRSVCLADRAECAATKNSKVGSGNTAKSRESVQSGGCRSELQARGDLVRTQWNIFKTTEEEHFTRY